MPRRRKAPFACWCEYALMLVGVALARMLPLPAARRAARVVFRVGSHLPFLPFRRRSIQHIIHAGVRTDRKSAEELAKRVYGQFSQLGVEVFKFDQCFDPAKFRCVGEEAVLDRFIRPDASGRSPEPFIMITGHYGNWEVLGAGLTAITRRPLVSLMRPFSNPLIEKLVMKVRSGELRRLVYNDRQMPLRPILRALREGACVTVAMDQHASRREGIETTFFGQPCRTHKTPALLHLKTGIPILPLFCRRLPGDDFSFELLCGHVIEYRATGDKKADVRAITQRCNDELQRLIAADPEQWLWAHRRWLNINRKWYREAEK